ncbi:dihydrodipicolinate synthase family protein [Candidatus Puniceispirillum marinum]|uniref:Dihydrodipicolinate synthetase n=1 Tax=Puniceispirillum marinum (strain IMCC1322) TaxID=488538 RepID=D5BNX6_PUNMI|nr:dihydrodipicolinate synthase family protein [Candidatus Puniceispirillum marinum]ADE40410.1 Dihydrodipicolinate synthetase [Candidatus Puniceispirillum marinum IMCC1322]
MKFRGIYTPAITPLHDDESIDWDGFDKVLEFLIETGVDGIIIGGTTGEYYAHSTEERETALKRATDVVAGRVPLIGGTGAIRTEDSIALAMIAKASGYDAILITTPPYAQPTPRENAIHALRIDRAVDMPIMLYNYPGRMAAEMSDEYLDRVGRSQNFRVIKESSGDINRVHQLARDYAHIQLSCGMDDQALEFFAWGAESWVCAGSNFAPEAHIALWKTCVVDGDFALGRKIMSAMLPLMATLEQGGKFLQCIKYGATLRGLPSGPPRSPLRSLNKDEKRSLAEVIAVMNKTINELNAGEAGK